MPTLDDMLTLAFLTTLAWAVVRLIEATQSNYLSKK